MLDLAFVVLLDFLARLDGNHPKDEVLPSEPIVSCQQRGEEKNYSKGATDAADEKRDPQAMR